VSPRFGPYGKIQILKAEVNRLIDLLLEEPSSVGPGWHPPVDVVDRPEGITVQVEVPGVAAQDVTAEVAEGVLTIRGIKRRLASEPPARRFHLMERYIGAFQLTVELPQPVDPADAGATLSQGILTITLPRLEDRRRRSFVIRVADPKEEHD